jgi:hypothetical protein
MHNCKTLFLVEDDQKGYELHPSHVRSTTKIHNSDNTTPNNIHFKFLSSILIIASFRAPGSLPHQYQLSPL